MSNLTHDDIHVGHEYRVVDRFYGHDFKVGDVVRFVGGRNHNLYERGDGVQWFMQPTEVDYAHGKPSTDRHYVTGVPICVTINAETGAVTFDVDLTEIHDVIENVEGDITPQVEADVSTVSVAAGRLGNALTLTIHRVTQEAS